MTEEDRMTLWSLPAIFLSRNETIRPLRAGRTRADRATQAIVSEGLIIIAPTGGKRLLWAAFRPPEGGAAGSGTFLEN